MLSGGVVNVGLQGEKINLLSPSGHSTPFPTNSLSNCDFGGSFFHLILSFSLGM
jgi:hypothetical protein